MPAGQTFLLRRGRKTKLLIYRGYSVHVILPKIHFEFIYESNDAILKDSGFAILTSEWLISLDLNPDAVHMYLEDLAVHQEVPCANMTEKNGMVFHAQGQMIFMQPNSTISIHGGKR
jgi:hypothetical protein